MTCPKCKDADEVIAILRKTIRDQEHEIVRLRIKLQRAESKAVKAVGREA